ncbi:Muscarinic acetylcholine receptor DM1 [Amphibalanus amphitrite]|uniref:Muscarinic acetylcholine receptor DM1 n=2 Tax=Amphibalanus amphitrite TaxID=1232801 RepID=A0A6A4W2J2_AMPAM|nr:Muscarinic acetylcholine receptor DM1 [Amphibalanus amphitrite]
MSMLKGFGRNPAHFRIPDSVVVTFRDLGKSQTEEGGSESHRRRADRTPSQRDDSLRSGGGGRPTPARWADKGGGSWRRLSAWCGGGSDRAHHHSAMDLPLAARTAPNGRHQSLRQTNSAVYTTPTYMCTYGRHTIPSPLPILSGLRRNASAGTLGASRSLSSESVYTIVIKFPEPVTPSADPSITMLSDSDADAEAGHQPHCPLSRSPAPAAARAGAAAARAARRPAAAAAAASAAAEDDSDSSDEDLPLPPPPPVSRRPSQLPDLRIPLNARVIPKQLAKAPNPKKKKKREEKKQERKAAKTLSAILLAFIITWTPYNVLVLIRVMLECDDCIPDQLWNFSYYLCYINSTVNPLCYALCNASFRRTYVKILTCTWSKNKRHPANRVYYN